MRQILVSFYFFVRYKKFDTGEIFWHMRDILGSVYYEDDSTTRIILLDQEWSRMIKNDQEWSRMIK